MSKFSRDPHSFLYLTLVGLVIAICLLWIFAPSCGGYGGLSCDHNGVPFESEDAELEYIAQRKAKAILYAEKLKNRTEELVEESRNE